jgi:SAM-dependent methyltransferase
MRRALTTDRRIPMRPSQPACQTRSNALGWIADVVRHRGVLGALGFYGAAAIELLRDLTPERRRSRYGDTDYDFDHRVDTTWATVSLRTRLRELLSGAQYQASEPELFHEILRALPVSSQRSTFIDLGSGKGRTLLMASDYPFQRIIGVELLEELNQIARQNIASYYSEEQKCFNIEAYCDDAREFKFPPQRLVLYLFNPFPNYVLQTVLENLRTSVVSLPREVCVVYHNLVHENIFRSQTWLREVHRTYQFAIYRAQ